MQQEEESDSARSKKKVAGRPKRALSAYNLFFKSEREKILLSAPERAEGKPRRSHGKIGFAPLARAVAERWKNIDERERDYYEQKAADDKIRYKTELEIWEKSGGARGEDGDKNDADSKIPAVAPAARLPSRPVPPPIAPRGMPLPDPNTAEDASFSRRLAAASTLVHQELLDANLYPPGARPPFTNAMVNDTTMNAGASSLANGQYTQAQSTAPQLYAGRQVASNSEAAQNMAIQQGRPNHHQLLPLLLQHQHQLQQQQQQILQEQQQQIQQRQEQQRQQGTTSSVARLAETLDEESIDYISNLFQKK